MSRLLKQYARAYHLSRDYDYDYYFDDDEEVVHLDDLTVEKIASRIKESGGVRLREHYEKSLETKIDERILIPLKLEGADEVFLIDPTVPYSRQEAVDKSLEDVAVINEPVVRIGEGEPMPMVQSIDNNIFFFAMRARGEQHLHEDVYNLLHYLTFEEYLETLKGNSKFLDDDQVEFFREELSRCVNVCNDVAVEYCKQNVRQFNWILEDAAQRNLERLRQEYQEVSERRDRMESDREYYPFYYSLP